MKVDVEAECSSLLSDKEDRGSMSRARLVDEPIVQVFINKGAEGVKLSRREGVDGTQRG